MNAPAAVEEPAGFGVGDSYYQVLEPAPDGENYIVSGPFADLDAASKFGITRPGSFIAVTLIVHGYPRRAPAAKPAG